MKNDFLKPVHETYLGLLHYAGDRACLVRQVRKTVSGNDKDFFHYLVQRHAQRDCPDLVDIVATIFWDYRRSLATK
jgi:saccharopine dehydrogenase-like NADP-dependent oxidoreductase